MYGLLKVHRAASLLISRKHRTRAPLEMHPVKLEQPLDLARPPNHFLSLSSFLFANPTLMLSRLDQLLPRRNWRTLPREWEVVCSDFGGKLEKRSFVKLLLRLKKKKKALIEEERYF